jgi:UPF0042 nucleotide-binding protein
MSGAGRTTAANALEDLDWYVVDNLPPQMLRPLLDISDLAAGALRRSPPSSTCAAAISFASSPLWRVRCAQRDSPGALPGCLGRRARASFRVRPAPAPAAGGRTILDGIRRERERLAVIRETRTSSSTRAPEHPPARDPRRRPVQRGGRGRHTVTVMSFGFKYGLPTDVDLVADMRFLPNPFWIPELKG